MSQDEVEERFLEELVTFLGRRDIEEFFLVHPNQLTVPGFCPSPSWSSWWDWSARDPSDASTNKPTSSPWDLLWQYYTVTRPTELAANEDDDVSDLIPAELRSLIDGARRLQLCRTRGTQATVPSLLAHAQGPRPRYPNKSIIHGMSPKKAHEVVYMTEHVSRTLSSLSQQGLDVRYVVDVGAGQVRVPFILFSPSLGPASDSHDVFDRRSRLLRNEHIMGRACCCPIGRVGVPVCRCSCSVT